MEMQIKKIDDKIWMVERADGLVLLIRYHYPCSHRTKDGDYARHIHYYVTSKDKIKNERELDKLLDWLDAGFWHDSCIWSSQQGLRQIIEQFLSNKCIGALQPF
jgi:hypothetical protein